ncbi:hybrid sensor histidine kinase response regulator [Chlorella sorokiniana]|uniref:histidine kinase n=1 Tax=Chlorella sorokiniana TaxID=3076 RepID=A0A2P6U313_CHLSO|nr:hybrid sensor histidine kinase response regulator [Chlorella sorokiniana]|eukprot:PRW60699.1 hybrid sensor histidine kinase response regulator [Chlorella sorokiniana]
MPASKGSMAGHSAQRTGLHEPIEELPDRRLHFSRSVTLVSLCTMSYAFWIFYLCGHSESEATLEFYRVVPPTVYMWPMVAFATAVLLNLLSMAMERRPVKRQLCFLNVYISGVAFVFEFLAWKQSAPIYINAAGRPTSLMRFVMWAHATPIMLYTLSLISDFSTKQLYQTLGVNVFMIVAVIPGELIPAWHRWIWNGLSCAVYPYIFHQIFYMYSAGIREARETGAQTSLRTLRNFTLSFWTFFPCVWVLVQLGWVDLYHEEVLWCVADTMGKIIFSSTLLHSNFMSIEHRRMMAMRVVEEANRIRVIHELRQLVEQKEQFIALMSHELRTPLNGIIGLSNVLLMDVDSLPPDTCKTVTTIRNSGARLLNLINDILDAAALRKGKLAVQQGKVNLKNVADDVVDLTEALAKPGVNIRNKITADAPLVVGDTSRIVQVLYNLIGNAAKFTERGDIWVDATSSPDGATVAVSVHDTGIGIPEDKLDDIFAPFAQVDMSTTRRYGGTGLGLNLVKQLVEAHGGSISVASRRGKGSVFTFTLRVYAQDDGGSPGPVTAQQRHSLALAAQEAADAAAEELDEVSMPNPEEEPLLASGRMSRKDSEPDMMLRLSHDAQPANMLQRLSADSRLRSSYDADYANYHKAPQQLSPQAALNAFLSAGPHQVVKEIQKGNITKPEDVAAATNGGDGNGGNGGSGGNGSQGDVEEEGPLAHDWLLADQVVQRQSSAGQVKVLSVDDDPVNQMVIQAMLGKAGFKVLKAADGQKALDLLEESLRQGDPPHVMLLDVMMPGLSGYDVVRLVRERHPTLMLPVILVSANSREEHVVEGLQAGANDYVTKPFGRNELVARIQAQLRTREFSQGVRASLAAACQGLQQQQQQQAPQQGADGSLGWEGNRRLSLPVVERAASAPPDGLPPWPCMI